MSSKDTDVMRGFGRNLVLGGIFTFAATILLCFAATHDLQAAVTISILPASFATPFVGLMITYLQSERAGND